MSDSSIRTKPSIDEPSNMIWPSSAEANWRFGISTFLMTPRMSVNCRRMNFTFVRSASSRIFALRSAPPGSVAGDFGSAMRFQAPSVIPVPAGWSGPASDVWDPGIRALASLWRNAWDSRE